MRQVQSNQISFLNALFVKDNRSIGFQVEIVNIKGLTIIKGIQIMCGAWSGAASVCAKQWALYLAYVVLILIISKIKAAIGQSLHEEIYVKRTTKSSYILQTFLLPGFHFG